MSSGSEGRRKRRGKCLETVDKQKSDDVTQMNICEFAEIHEN